MPIDLFGDHAGYLLRNGAVQEAAEKLLMDIAKLEAEKAEKGGQTLIDRARGASGVQTADTRAFHHRLKEAIQCCRQIAGIKD